MRLKTIFGISLYSDLHIACASKELLTNSMIRIVNNIACMFSQTRDRELSSTWPHMKSRHILLSPQPLQHLKTFSR